MPFNAGVKLKGLDVERIWNEVDFGRLLNQAKNMHRNERQIAVPISELKCYEGSHLTALSPIILGIASTWNQGARQAESHCISLYWIFATASAVR